MELLILLFLRIMSLYPKILKLQKSVLNILLIVLND